MRLLPIIEDPEAAFQQAVAGEIDHASGCDVGPSLRRSTRRRCRSRGLPRVARSASVASWIGLQSRMLRRQRMSSGSRTQ